MLEKTKDTVLKPQRTNPINIVLGNGELYVAGWKDHLLHLAIFNTDNVFPRCNRSKAIEIVIAIGQINLLHPGKVC